jgi:hypothetical protein
VRRLRAIRPQQPDGPNAFYRGVWVEGGEEIEVMIKQFGSTPPDLVAIWKVWSVAESPHIARLRFTYPPDPGRAAGVANYEVTDYLPPGSLYDFVDNKPVSLSTARLMLRQIADALEYLHSGSSDADAPRPALTHGDIKPGNILVRSREPLVLCLTDFGAAQLTEDRDEDRPVKMTVPYAAPEAPRYLSPAADWWSVGITLLELIQGYHPFALQTTGAMMPDKQIRDDIHERTVPIGPQVDGDWHDLIRGLLSAKRDARWGSRQVREWLAGGSPTVDDSLGPAERAYRPFPFVHGSFVEPARLAAAMGYNWDAAAKLVVGREWRDLLEWSRTISSALRAKLDHAGRNLHVRGPGRVDRMITEVLVALGPGTTPMFRGHAVHPAGLMTLVKAAAAGDATATDVLRALLVSAGLRVYGRLPQHAQLDEIDRTWQRWYQLASTAATYEFGSVKRLPLHGRLPAMLLRVQLDERYRDRLRDRAKELSEGRLARHSGALTRLAEAAAGDRADDAPALHLVIVLAEPVLRQGSGKQARGAAAAPVAGTDPDRAQRGSRAAGLDRAVRLWTRASGMRSMLRLRHPTDRSTLADRSTKLPYLRPRRTRRQRVLLGVRAASVLLGSVLLTALAGVGVAAATSKAQGVLVAVALAAAGACLLLAVVLRGSRLTSILIGAWSGAVCGAVLAFLAGGAAGAVLGPRTGWPVFWLAWAATVMTLTARGAVR